MIGAERKEEEFQVQWDLDSPPKNVSARNKLIAERNLSAVREANQSVIKILRDSLQFSY